MASDTLRHFLWRRQKYLSNTFLFSPSTKVLAPLELGKEHELESGLVSHPPGQGLDDGEENLGDCGGVVVELPRSLRSHRVLHRGVEAGVNYPLEGRPSAEFKKLSFEIDMYQGIPCVGRN